MNLYRLDSPQKMHAATSGDGSERWPFRSIYHDCCRCFAKEPVIAGLASNDPANPMALGIVNTPRGGYPAYYCELCMAELESAALARQGVTQ